MGTCTVYVVPPTMKDLLDNYLTSINYNFAGTIGFEPTVRITPARLTVLCHRPLGHIPVFL